MTTATTTDGDLVREVYSNPRTVLWGRSIQLRSGEHVEMAGRAGLSTITATGEVTRFPLPRPDEVETTYVGQCHPWECPTCEADSVLYSTTENGFDWLFCPDCLEWHRKPVAAGVDDAVCESCGVGVSALERLLVDGDQQWVCAFCAAREDER